MISPTRRTRGQKASLTKPERQTLLKSLKTLALDGDTNAALALSNLELAAVTQQRISLQMGADFS